MHYADTRPVDAAPVVRLGLRTRLRAVREARTTSPRARQRLAKGIENAVARAEQGYVPFSAAVPVARDAAEDARGVLLDLAERLRAPRPAHPDGVLLARELLLDGAGPLYAPAGPGDLRAAALRALRALRAMDGHGARR
jgi:hypothetical protein